MAFDVIITDEAEADIDEAIQWYEEQQAGLGIRFYNLLLEKLDKIQTSPQFYFLILEDYRRIVIDPFPYGIIYKITGSVVLVLAVFHQSINPSSFIKRVKK